MATDTRESLGQGVGFLEQFQLKGVLDTGRKIGDGSYASVKELNFCGLKCVGKKIHALLYNMASASERAKMLHNFGKECELLSRLHHPCIVQFLGICFEDDSELPVLIMEYLHSTLAECLQKYGILPEEISYRMLRDVALGLRYLHEHSPPVIHRDLSANNVLLTTDMSAKISDLGVAKMLNLSPATMTQKVSTQAPGTPCYMPPEALVSKPSYTSKIDNYSYGVMVMHVLCGKWPFPADAFHMDPQGSLVPISEFDRRAEYIQEIGMDHPLIELIRRCLSNSPSSRPEASEILCHVEALVSQFPPSCENNVEVVVRNNTRAAVLEATVRDAEVLETELQLKELEVESQRKEMDSLRQEIKALREENKSQKEELGGLKSQLKKPFKPPTVSLCSETSLQWTRCADMPVGMGRPHSVVLKGKVYVGGGITDKKDDLHLVLEYDPERDGWVILPRHPLVWFALGQFQGRLISVGGVLDSLTNKVLYYNEEACGWEEWLQPLPTARCLLSIITTESAVIACGGTNTTYEYCNNVDVYVDDTCQWHASQPLPISCAVQKATIVADTCYLLGGNDSTKNPTPTVLCALVDSLVEKARSQYNRSGSLTKLSNTISNPQVQRSASLPHPRSSSLWTILRDTPMRRSAGAALDNTILAIGGFDHRDQASRAVYVYLPATNAWVRMARADLPAAVRSASAIKVADSQLLVCGGRDSQKRAMKTVYMCCK